MNQSESFKIGLIIENKVDQVIIDSFAQKILPSASFRSFRMGMGIAAFYVADILILDLLPKGYQHFILIFEVNTTEKYEITRTINMLTRPLKESGIVDFVTFCPIVPNLNAWLLDRYKLPKKEFGQEFDLLKIQEVANQIDINVLKQKNASFAQFAQALQQWNVQKMAA